MSTSTQPATLAGKKRSAYRRLLLLTVLLIIGMFAGWMVWGAIRDWADAKALAEYFTELEAREPGWKDRVYGKPLTPAQIDDHQKWRELQQALVTNNAAWGLYRQGLYAGMYQNPGYPAATLPAEQVEFMKAAHQFWQPVLQKLEAMEKLPGQHRSIDRDAPYEKIAAQFGGANSTTAYLLNESIELEVLYHIMMNDPEQALRWMTRCKAATLTLLFASPFLVERWLNLTEPKPGSLLSMQQLLEQCVQGNELSLFANFCDELRLLEKLIREISQGELATVHLERMGITYGLVTKDSPLNTPWLGWARPYYLKFRVGTLFQRPNHVILRLHQLIDRIEGLSKLDLAIRWSTWKQFAEDNIMLRDFLGWQQSEKKNSDAIPDGLRYLATGDTHSRVMIGFEQQAQLNTALAAVVVERFRVDHGRFPTEWSELVPRYVAKPILDHFNGKPLQLKLNEKGIVVYSVGRDGQDDGGEKISHNHYWLYGGKGWDRKNTNLGTRVYLPALRRGTPIQLAEAQSDALKQNTPEMLKLMKKGRE